MKPINLPVYILGIKAALSVPRLAVAAVSYGLCRGQSASPQRLQDFVPRSLYKKVLSLFFSLSVFSLSFFLSLHLSLSPPLSVSSSFFISGHFSVQLLFLVPRLFPEARIRPEGQGGDGPTGGHLGDGPALLWSFTDGTSWTKTVLHLWRHAAFQQLQQLQLYQVRSIWIRFFLLSWRNSLPSVFGSNQQVQCFRHDDEDDEGSAGL